MCCNNVSLECMHLAYCCSICFVIICSLSIYNRGCAKLLFTAFFLLAASYRLTTSFPNLLAPYRQLSPPTTASSLSVSSHWSHVCACDDHKLCVAFRLLVYLCLSCHRLCQRISLSRLCLGYLFFLSRL